MLQEEHRIVAIQGPGEQALGVIRTRRDHNAQAGKVAEHRIIVAGVVRRGRVANADAASQQDRHLEPAAAHVLHFCDLIENLANSIKREVGEHEVDHGSSAGHGSAGGHADEPSLADRRVAEPDRSITVEQTGRRREVTTALADSLTHHEDTGVLFHLQRKSFKRGLHERGLATPGDRSAVALGASTLARRRGRIHVVRGRRWVGPRTLLGE